jgi:hypothetical protein
MALDGLSTSVMSPSSSPMSSSTFLRFVGGRLEVKLPDERRLRPSFRTVGAGVCWEQKGSKSAIENFSDTEGRVSHSFMVPITRAPVAGTRGGVGR